jgi:hypothetical protein
VANATLSSRILPAQEGHLRYHGGVTQGARALLERAAAILEARLGAGHALTVRGRQNLAAVIAELDDQE